MTPNMRYPINTMPKMVAAVPLLRSIIGFLFCAFISQSIFLETPSLRLSSSNPTAHIAYSALLRQRSWELFSGKKAVVVVACLTWWTAVSGSGKEQEERENDAVERCVRLLRCVS